MWERLQAIRERFETLTQQLYDPATAANPAALARIAREHRELEPIVRALTEYERIRGDLEEYRKLLREGGDAELVEWAKSEIRVLEPELEAHEERLRQLLIPKDPADRRNAIVEIRAGTGGEEAALFARDLFRMYTRYAERKGWTWELLDAHPSDLGGFKEVVLLVNGPDAYGHLKYESGVHRVQRVPETESSGRIHTSAATVAVLPEAEEVDVEIRPEELRIDVFRAGGPGGQNVNKVETAVRITHLPTGLVVSCQDERSQHQNREKAMRLLRAKLYEIERQRQEQERAQMRRSMVSTGDRSAKVRTYNFPQSRVTDHRVGLTLYQLSEVLDGALDPLIEALRIADVAEKIKTGSL
ncbi:MAG: peptide chain release factor 1 [Bacteroidetes bacterium]|nr:peptide chain release factor 1 [Rhodothermia bacterium]MCS7154506.1 peptide chain release factor 1 [Bacteroidota bacterium]MCX7906879.1 peptide chain release factor 1 [Bacteroidota bacterium]MDW8136842.1 peptide chain release factor 1 [Bacteroidota bacterium]MDW8285288.1 peptide chain release factor 1 [Bacteroidota bacterium]